MIDGCLPTHPSALPSMSAKPSLLAALVHHYDELVEHVRRRFGDRGFAQEVVHDVCVEMLERSERHGIQSPLALLRKISSDRAVDRYRSERRRRALTAPLVEAAEPVCPAPSPYRHCESERELERLVEAIEALPVRCRMVFVMHKIHGLPQGEVARQMGISLKTVEKHLRLGMLACRAHLERKG
ncbi:RNA polymerase ECF-subfamily sigma-70 factor [Pseudomonas sp. ATCC 13867]|nr:RNA polymerase ECF-subfamily sigma-70 factor [Pseudomonas sp. ATCC 13867]